MLTCGHRLCYLYISDYLSILSCKLADADICSTHARKLVLVAPHAGHYKLRSCILARTDSIDLQTFFDQSKSLAQECLCGQHRHTWMVVVG